MKMMLITLFFYIFFVKCMAQFCSKIKKKLNSATGKERSSTFSTFDHPANILIFDIYPVSMVRLGSHLFVKYLDQETAKGP